MNPTKGHTDMNLGLLLPEKHVYSRNHLAVFGFGLAPKQMDKDS